MLIRGIQENAPCSTPSKWLRDLKKSADFLNRTGRGGGFRVTTPFPKTWLTRAELKAELKAALENYPTKAELKAELENHPTKTELSALETRSDYADCHMTASLIVGADRTVG